jgi:hypothetical protein
LFRLKAGVVVVTVAVANITVATAEVTDIMTAVIKGK